MGGRGHMKISETESSNEDTPSTHSDIRRDRISSLSIKKNNQNIKFRRFYTALKHGDF